MTFYTMDAMKGVRIEDLPDDAWTFYSGGKESSLDKLYATVAWMYRCVKIRANAVASMPFELRQGENPILTFDGTSYDMMPEGVLGWMIDFPELLAKTEAASVLAGEAYWEPRRNVIDTGVAQFDWLLPSSITPEISETEGLEFFWRQLSRRKVKLDIDEVIYFWMPDHMVEIGPAVSFDGRSVMNNAGVIGSMDLFLQGYFERGLIKATLLSYTGEPPSQDERNRIKAWWKRVTAGLKNAFANEIIRGDFKATTIGEGINDLGDHALTDKERESIASGLGVPQSKVAANASNFATKQSDDVMFIEDTVIPEVSWIHKTLNKQVFWPMGYNLVATPQKLRVMQHDETQRSAAFKNYVDAGLPIEATIEMLGITVSEDIMESIIAPQVVQTDSGGDDASLAVANREAGGDVDKVLLNGAQITSALAIVDKVAMGAIDAQTGINMMQAFLGINPSVGAKLVPTDGAPPEPPQEVPEQLRSISDIMRTEEVGRLKRWAEKRPDANADEFRSDVLTVAEIRSVANSVRSGQPVVLADSAAEALFLDAMERFNNALED